MFYFSPAYGGVYFVTAETHIIYIIYIYNNIILLYMIVQYMSEIIEHCLVKAVTK